MSIDDTQNNGNRSPAIDNSIIKGRTPNPSTSPKHQEGRSINNEEDHIKNSTKQGSSIQQHVLANKMRDINKQAMVSKRTNANQNTNYMNFGSNRNKASDLNN